MTRIIRRARSYSSLWEDELQYEIGGDPYVTGKFRFCIYAECDIFESGLEYSTYNDAERAAIAAIKCIYIVRKELWKDV